MPDSNPIQNEGVTLSVVQKLVLKRSHISEDEMEEVQTEEVIKIDLRWKSSSLIQCNASSHHGAFKRWSQHNPNLH